MLNLEQLDDVSFEELVEASLTELAKLCPEWTDYNAHDPGVTFLEMLMWLTEMQRYYACQMTEFHQMRYLELLGLTPEKVTPSRIVSHFQTEEDYLQLPENLMVYLGDVPFQLEDSITLTNATPMLAYSLDDTWLSPKGFEPVSDDNLFYIKLSPLKINLNIISLYFSLSFSYPAPKVPMRKGFIPQAIIKVFLEEQGKWLECDIEDETFGFAQSGFLKLKLPVEVSGNCVLKVLIQNADIFPLPTITSLYTQAGCLRQIDEGHNTLGTSGRAREMLEFSFAYEGKNVSALTFQEIESGCDNEKPNDAFARYQVERFTPSRAVTQEDYIDIALQTPGLRADNINVFSDRKGKVCICVKPTGERLTESTIRNLRTVLFQAKPAGIELEIVPVCMYHARIFTSLEMTAWAKTADIRKLILNYIAPLQENFGLEFPFEGIITYLKESSLIKNVKWFALQFTDGRTFIEKDKLKLPENGLLVIDDVLI